MNPCKHPHHEPQFQPPQENPSRRNDSPSRRALQLSEQKGRLYQIPPLFGNGRILFDGSYESEHIPTLYSFKRPVPTQSLQAYDGHPFDTGLLAQSLGPRHSLFARRNWPTYSAVLDDQCHIRPMPHSINTGRFNQQASIRIHSIIHLWILMLQRKMVHRVGAF